MVIRNAENINVDTCIPIFSDTLTCFEDYKKRIKQIEEELYIEIKKLNIDKKYNISININNLNSGSQHPYMLALGSCIECGEEGLVGRGNGLSGLIPTMRAKSNEAYFGKNPVYHVGRVLGFLTQKISNRIYLETGSGNSIYSLALHSDALMPPTNLCISLQEMTPEVKGKVEKILEEEFDTQKYLRQIISNIFTSDFSSKIL